MQMHRSMVVRRRFFCCFWLVCGPWKFLGKGGGKCFFYLGTLRFRWEIEDLRVFLMNYHRIVAFFGYII